MLHSIITERTLCNEKDNTRSALSSTDNAVFRASQCRRNGEPLPGTSEDGMEMEKALGRNSGELGRAKPKAASQPQSARAMGNQVGAADAEEVPRRFVAGISESVSIWLQKKLWLLQENGESGTSLEEKEERASE